MRVFSLRFAIGWLMMTAGCDVVSPTDGGGTSASDGQSIFECLDPVTLISEIDYNCGDEVVLVIVTDTLTGDIFVDPFVLEGQVADMNRFVLINETDFEVEVRATLTGEGEATVIEDMPLIPLEAVFIDGPCAGTFTWGDLVEGLCFSAAASE